MTELAAFTRERSRIGEVETSVDIHDQIVGTLERLPTTTIIKGLNFPIGVDALNIPWYFATVISDIEITVRSQRGTIGCTSRISKGPLGTVRCNRGDMTTDNFGD